jgi:hypothetical protein
LAEKAGQVGGHHNATAWQPVGDDTTDEQAHDQRDTARGEDVAEIGW